jgi:hypothetical protein
MVHRPAAASETVVEETVQMVGVDEPNVTVRPEVDVAEREKELMPSVLFESVAKVMVWLALLTVTVCVVVEVS